MISEFVPTGRIPQCIEMIRALGLELPQSVYEAAQRGVLQAEEPPPGMSSH